MSILTILLEENSQGPCIREHICALEYCYVLMKLQEKSTVANKTYAKLDPNFLLPVCLFQRFFLDRSNRCPNDPDPVLVKVMDFLGDYQELPFKLKIAHCYSLLTNRSWEWSTNRTEQREMSVWLIRPVVRATSGGSGHSPPCRNKTSKNFVIFVS